MTDTNVAQLVIHQLTKAQYNQLQPQPNQLYFVTDEIPLDTSDVVTSIGVSSTDLKVPSAKAVYNFVHNNTEGFLRSITSQQVITALGYTPYNSTNPSGYLTGITSGMITTALGYTPYSSANPTGYQTASDVSSLISTHNSNYTAHQDIRNAIITNLSGLSDVAVSGVTSGQFLSWNGTKWVPVTSSASVSWGGIGGTLSNQTDLQTVLNGKLPTTTKYGYSISYSGSTLTLKDQDGTALSTATIASAASLSSLTDTSISSPTSGQILKYNGSSWVNSSLSALQNTATGSYSLSVLGSATTRSQSINIGVSSSADNDYTTVIGSEATSQGQKGTAVGYGAHAHGLRSTAIGHEANVYSNATDAIQIGPGDNATPTSCYVGLGGSNYQLLDSSGYIPIGRISSTSNKEAIVGWGMPDYSAGIDISGYTSSSNQFTAPKDGLISICINSDIDNKVYINNTARGFANNNDSYARATIVLPMSKNETFYAPSVTNQTNFVSSFYPYKGA